MIATRPLQHCEKQSIWVGGSTIGCPGTTCADDWKLAILHQDPEFISLVDELEADIEAQRHLYEENKDKPLF